MTVTLADIETARRTIGTQVLRTPMLPAPKLSALTGAQVCDADGAGTHPSPVPSARRVAYRAPL